MRDHISRIGQGGGLARRALQALTAVAVMSLVVASGTAAAEATEVSRAPVGVFQAAGDIGGGELDEGATFPPTSRGFATLKRGTDWVQVNIQTSGLPAGAYTVWWLVFDMPDNCTGGACNMDDLFNSAARASVFYATGGIVQGNGIGNFVDRYRVGDDLGEPGSQHLIGDGALTPTRAEVHNVIKYHGPASADPDVRHEQTHTVHGSCSTGANAVDLGPPFGIQCFDPQAVAHPRP